MKKIKYKFFTKNYGVSKGIYKSLNCGIKSLDRPENVKMNLKIAMSAITKSSKLLVMPSQSHSNKCIIVNSSKGKFLCDALVTKNRNLILGVTTADCIPIIFTDSSKLIIGICHAGWKGLVSGVIENTVNKMIRIGSLSKNIKATIGPCIRRTSYEVSENFVQNLKENDLKYISKSRNKFFFDLPKAAKSRLKYLGIDQINDTRKNTYRDINYFSYRLSCHKKLKDYGRNISLVSIN